MLLPVITASIAAAAGTTMQTAPLVRIGTTAFSATASTFLACDWSRVPDDMLKIVHPCTIFNDEFALLQTRCCWEPRTSMSVLKSHIRVHFSSTSLRRSLKRRCCVEPAASMPLLPVRLSGYGLLSSVRPCTLFPDIHPCMSGKDKFCAQNLLLINFPPILGRSDDKFFYRKTYYCLEPPPSVAVRGETEPAKCVVWCSVVLKKR